MIVVLYLYIKSNRFRTNCSRFVLFVPLSEKNLTNLNGSSSRSHIILHLSSRWSYRAVHWVLILNGRWIKRYLYFTFCIFWHSNTFVRILLQMVAFSFTCETQTFCLLCTSLHKAKLFWGRCAAKMCWTTEGRAQQIISFLSENSVNTHL